MIFGVDARRHVHDDADVQVLELGVDQRIYHAAGAPVAPTPTPA